MCKLEGRYLQKGMNVQKGRKNSVFLMSRRKDALYADRVEDDGKVLVYEGHDVRKEGGIDPKSVDQPAANPDGTPTDNGKFIDLAQNAKAGREPRRVHVYEKLERSVWLFKGAFELVDAWPEDSKGRNVWKFKLHLIGNADDDRKGIIANPRVVSSDVIAEVWKRDGGKCTKCGATENLHLDHIIPYSKGGTSLRAENIQILCARHNLSKGARIA